MRYIDELNERFGQAIRDTVVKDIANGRTIVPTKVRRIATVLALLIVATPYLVAMAGAAIIAFNLDSVPAMICGAPDRRRSCQ